MNFVVSSLERCTQQQQQIGDRIRETERKAQELEAQVQNANARHASAREEAQASQHEHAEALAARQNLEKEVTGMREHNQRLRQEVARIAEIHAQLDEGRIKDKQGFIEQCQHLQRVTRELIDRCDARTLATKAALASGAAAGQAQHA